MAVSLADLRENYSRAGLSEAEAGDCPWSLFRKWIEEAIAAELPEPNAMILATCTRDGIPSARAVLLKDLDERGFTFYTNYESRKACELTENPRAALVFLWHPLERQIRVEGEIERVSAAESDAYFAKRPIASRIGACVSVQSAVISGRELLELSHAELSKRYADGNVPRPARWGGYRVIPSLIEFWQGRRSRLHDRIRFTRTPAGGWLKDRLAP